MERWVPEWFDRSLLREWMSAGVLSKHLRVGTWQASYFLRRREDEGRPVPTRCTGRWRPIDVMVAARADGLTIGPPREVQLRMDLARLSERVAALQATHRQLSEAIERIQPHAQLHDILSITLGHRKRLASREEVVAHAQPVTRHIGVYFLVHGDEVVYVGQSVNVYGRVMGHFTGPEKQFDRATWVPVEREDLDVVESLYIHALRPRLNGAPPLALWQLVEMLRPGVPA